MINVVLLLCGTGGLMAHWASRWLGQRTDASLYAYFFVNERRRTAGTLLTFAASMFGYLASEPAWSLGTAYAAFSVGYLIDSALNKG